MPTITSDSQAPVTTTNAAASYWNTAAITATATDNEGIAYVYNQHRRWPRAAHHRCRQAAQLRRQHPGGQGSAAGGRDAHTLKYWAQDVNGNVEAQKVVTFTLTMDAAKPETTMTGATEGAWYKSAVPVHLAAADTADGSGVKDLSYSLDGAADVVVTGPAAAADVTVPAVAGAHTIAYHATDVAGNAEDTRTLTVNVDLSKPVTSASAVSAVKGRTATLKFKVAETTANAGKATVVIKVKNKRR